MANSCHHLKKIILLKAANTEPSKEHWTLLELLGVGNLKLELVLRPNVILI